MQAIVCGFFWCYIMTMLPNQGGVLDWKELENRGSSNFYFFRTLSSAASPPTKHIPSLDAHDSSQECRGRDRKRSLLSCVLHSHFYNWTEYTQDEWVCKCNLQGILKGGEWVHGFRRSGASRGSRELPHISFPFRCLAHRKTIFLFTVPILTFLWALTICSGLGGC